jgi:hypothetical protein
MLKRHLDRVISVLIVSGVLAWMVARDLLKKHQLSREGFLQYESRYFDKYLSEYTHPVSHAIVYAFSFALVLLAYEFVVFIIRRCYAMIQNKNEGNHV